MAADSPEHAKGDVIADKFRIVRRLGQGGMGEVYEAEHVITNKRVALKIMLAPKGIEDESAQQRFFREARAACAIHHPAIVNVHDLFTANERLIIVMDLLKGRDLYAVLGHKKVHHLMAIEYLLPIASAIGALHAKGFIHRDIKPENIFVAEDGATYLLDLGIVKDTHAEKRLTTDAVGTPMYMAPEQAFGQPIDHRADIWSLGLVMYEALTGNAPTEAESMGQVFELIREAAFPAIADPEVPPDLAAFVLTMISRFPAHRAQGMDTVYDALARYANSTLLARYPRPPAPPPTKDAEAPRKPTLPQGSSEPPPAFNNAVEAVSERIARDVPTIAESRVTNGETPAPMITPNPAAKKKKRGGARNAVYLVLLALGFIGAIAYFGLVIYKGGKPERQAANTGAPAANTADAPTATATAEASVSSEPTNRAPVPEISAAGSSVESSASIAASSSSVARIGSAKVPTVRPSTAAVATSSAPRTPPPSLPQPPPAMVPPPPVTVPPATSPGAPRLIFTSENR